jgi:hypothetical protein
VRRERRSLLSREKRVTKVEIDLDGDRYYLHARDAGLETTRCPVSGGIALKAQELDLPAWIDELTGAIGREAQRSAAAQQALQRMLT